MKTIKRILSVLLPFILLFFNISLTASNVCPNNIVQNGCFDDGSPTSDDEDISNATAWSGVWQCSPDEIFCSTGDFYNTTTSTPPAPDLLTPSPSSQGNFGALWISHNTTNSIWREGIMNQLNSTINPSSGCYQITLKIACLNQVSMTPELSIFGVPPGATGVIDPSQTSPSNENLFAPQAVQLASTTIASSCDENFQTLTFDFDSNILLSGGIDRIFITRGDAGSGWVFIAIDDVCLTQTTCPSPCPSLDFVWSYDNSQQYGTCCWNITLDQQYGNNEVKSVYVDNALGSDISIFPNTGWVSNNLGTNIYEISNTSGNTIPIGNYPTAFTACFENINSLPQQVDLAWNIEDPNNQDSCIIDCIETIFSDCPIPIDTCAIDTFFFRTGYDYENEVVYGNNGIIDPHWTINGQAMITFNPFPSYPNYQPPLANTQYIAPAVNASYTLFDVHFDFCLSDMPFNCTDLELYLDLRVDNVIHDIKLNGNPISVATSVNSFASINPTTFSFIPTAAECSFFNLGSNELTIRMENLSGPSAIDVSGYILSNDPDNTVIDYDCCSPVDLCACSNLEFDVSQGFIGPKFTMPGGCYGGMRPRNLTECDSISWTVDGDYIGSTTGSLQNQTHQFIGAINTEICMEVFRLDSNGEFCGPVMHCKTRSIMCFDPFPYLPNYPGEIEGDLITNSNFYTNGEEGLLNEVNIEGWETAYGQPYVKSDYGLGNEGYAILSGNQSEADGMMQSIAHTPGSNYILTMGISRYDIVVDTIPISNEIVVDTIPYIVIRLSDDPQLNPFENNGEVVETVIWMGAGAVSDSLLDIANSKIYIDTIFGAIPENWDNEIYVTVHVENNKEGFSDMDKTFWMLDNISLRDTMLVSTNNITLSNTINVFPVPTKNQLNISFDHPLIAATQIEVISLNGIAFLQDQIDIGENHKSLDIGILPSGVYFLKFTDSEGLVYFEKILKQ